VAAASSEIVLSAHGLRKAYGAIVVSDDLDFDLRRGEIHAVIGPNGAGKSSLVAQLAGELRPDAGTVTLLGEDVTRLGADARARRGLARSFQVTTLIDEFTAEDNVVLGILGRSAPRSSMTRALWAEAGIYREARELLERTGIAHVVSRRVDELAHGDRRVLELTVALAKRPQVVLLDEPMAGMGHDASRQLAELLAGLRDELSMVLIEHDMDAVERLADRVTVLVEGAVVASGQFNDVRRDERVRSAYLGVRG
jgi:branched-chain amino acid transport system ATP-binding protein